MFDIGFAELLIIAVVALLVVGPEKLPGTIRTVSVYINRLRRGFNEIKREVQQELHNDSVMQDLRKAGEGLKNESQAFTNHVKETVGDISSDVSLGSGEDHKDTPPAPAKATPAAKPESPASESATPESPGKESS
jgi:sec-independent protein translocase protein TatB